MLIASWFLLALAVGFVARSIVPARDRATRWIDLLILGLMGCDALRLQSCARQSGMPAVYLRWIFFPSLWGLLRRSWCRRFRAHACGEKPGAALADGITDTLPR